jgi:DNA-binding transcriptional MerR regulator
MTSTKSSPDKPQPELMRLAQAADSAGVSRQTIEYYIMIGLVQPIRRGKGRYFDDKLVGRIRLIRSLNDSGYTLRSIRETYLSRR